MRTLTALLLLVLGAETHAETHYPGATEVYQCMFDSSRDDEIYGWPPGWTRRQGPGFPRYVRMRVDDNHPPPGGRSMRVDLDGGSAMASSPHVPVNPQVQYVLEGYVETAGLRHDGACLSLIFLDSTRARLSSFSSNLISGTSAWQKVRVGPVSPPAGASFVVIALELGPSGQMQDLRGTASFGALWLGQLPQVTLTAQPVQHAPSAQKKAGRYTADERRVPARNAADVSFLIFPRGQPLEVICTVSGFDVPEYVVRLQQVDVDGRMLAEDRRSFSRSQPVTKVSLHDSDRPRTHRSANAREGQAASQSGKQESTSSARMTWQLPRDAVGFYRVCATVMPGGSTVPSSATAELSLVVIDPQVLPRGSEFGWSLSSNDAEVGLAPLADLVCQCGIRWVKFPFPTGEVSSPRAADGSKENSANHTKNDESRVSGPDNSPKMAPSKPTGEAGSSSKLSPANSLDALINFSDRLSLAGVQIAGVLQPPRVSGDASRTSFELLAAEAFARDPKTWYPSIEPVLSRLATEIRFWQIGDDRDPGWISCRDLPGVVSRTKAELDRIGQDLNIGFAWNLAAPMPAAPSNSPNRSSKANPAAPLPASSQRQEPPWRFLSLPCDDATGTDVLGQQLDCTRSAGIARWIVLDALPREGHTTCERIVNIVDRILTAKMHGAESVYFSNPLDSSRGLVDRNGSPSELFLPWRTTALILGGAPYVGDLDLPHGNQIHCFGGTGKYVGVLSGRKPGQETVYLGTDLQAHDVWGRNRACPPTISSDDEPSGLAPTPKSVITADRLPTYLTGLDGPITLWQLGVALAPNRLPSIPSAVLPIDLDLKNTLSQSVAGRVNVRGPQNWSIEPRTAEFRLAPGAPWKQHLEVTLPNDVVGGRQLLRLDFEIQADRLYRFTMYSPLIVSLGDVGFEGHAVLNERGQLEVRQVITNQGKKAASFRCDLLAPDRRRETAEVLIQPSGRNEMKYYLPEGERLRGTSIWLRAEEIDGPRVLNYRIETPGAATPSIAPSDTSNPHQPARPRSSLLL